MLNPAERVFRRLFLLGGAVQLQAVAAEEQEDKEYQTKVREEGFVAVGQVRLYQRQEEEDEGEQQVGDDSQEGVEDPHDRVRRRCSGRVEARPTERAGRRERGLRPRKLPAKVALHAPLLLATVAPRTVGQGLVGEGTEAQDALVVPRGLQDVGVRGGELHFVHWRKRRTTIYIYLPRGCTTTTTMPCKDCEKIQSLLREFQNNFKEVPVLCAMVQQLMRDMPDLGPARPVEDPYAEIISILPYGLWPVMA